MNATEILSRFEKTESGLHLIPIDLIERHPDNPRSDASYDRNSLKFRKLAGDFREAGGWSESHPATVHLNDDGTFTYIVGHRRSEVAKSLNIDLVPCVVLRGLSKAQILEKLHDHATVEGLDDTERLNVYLTLTREGWSGADIARKMGLFDRKGGPDQNKITKFKKLANLPESVQEAWVKFQKNPNASDLEFKPIGENLDKLADAKDKDYVNGWRGLVEQGPRYKAQLDKLANPKTREKPNYASKSVLKGMADTENVSPILKTLFSVLAGEGNDRLDDVVKAIHWMDNQAFGLNGRKPVQPNKVVKSIQATFDGSVNIDSEPEPVDSEPVDSEPVDSEPVDSEPVDSEPVDSEPVDSEPVDSEPVDSEPKQVKMSRRERRKHANA